jgi:hypothetical protein
MVWNESLDKLAYLAEKKIPKPKPFYSSNVIKDDKDNSNANEEKKGESGQRVISPNSIKTFFNCIFLM